MDRNGIASAVVSVSAPGVLLDDLGKTSRLAPACNQFAAQMVSDHPTRYGMFASLPLPDTSASLLELEYALDVLHAEGIVLMTNYRDRYLGDFGFVPVLDEGACGVRAACGNDEGDMCSRLAYSYFKGQPSGIHCFLWKRPWPNNGMQASA